MLPEVWAQMNLGKLEHVSPVSSESPTQASCSLQGEGGA